MIQSDASLSLPATNYHLTMMTLTLSLCAYCREKYYNHLCKIPQAKFTHAQLLTLVVSQRPSSIKYSNSKLHNTNCRVNHRVFT